MAIDAIHCRGQTEKQPSCCINTALLFVSSRIKKRESFGSCRHYLLCVEVQSKLLPMEWIVSVVCQGQMRSHYLELVWSRLAAVCALLFLPVRVCRSLLLSAALHHGLVLAHPQPPSLNDAGPLGSGFVLVVGVALQMLPAQPRLLFVVRLLLLVGHGLPPGA